jgi:hypothetical protein
MLREGDRVRMRVSICRVRAGAIGTIQHAFRSVSETYSVRFGSDPVPHLVSGDMLELMTEEQNEATED